MKSFEKIYDNVKKTTAVVGERLDRQRNLFRAEAEEKSSITERGLEEYESSLKINRDNLKGKKVLDIGSGTMRFAKEALEEGIQVYALDPYLKSEENINQSFMEKGGRKYATAARGQQLPYTNQQFDYIFSLYGLMWVPNQEDLELSVKEACRVLKPGGEIRIYPLLSDQLSIKLRNWLQENKYVIEHEESLLVIYKWSGAFNRL